MLGPETLPCIQGHGHGQPEPSAGEGAGKEVVVRFGAENWKPLTHLTHLHDHKLSLTVSPICVQHLTFYFCIGNNRFNYRSRNDPLWLEEARVEPV
jgi:hypothetical protein